MTEAPTPHPYRQHTPTCLNCGAETPGAYCSVCGQEASDYRVSARLFFRELLDALTLDSKFFRSVGPLLFRPGHLTKAFAEGKRVRYLRPLRLYLFTSFLFFVVVGMLLEQRIGSMDPTRLAEGFVNVTFHTDSLGMPLETDVREAMSSAANALEDFEEARNQVIAKIGREAVEEGLPDTTAARIATEVRAAMADRDAAQAEREAERLRAKALRADSLTDGPVAPLPEPEPERSFFEEFVRGINDSNGSLIGNDEGEIRPRTMLRSFISNIPVLMFFMVPFFALILKLLYVRRRRLYLEHLVFGFHTHAFLFMLIGLAIIAPVLPARFWVLITLFGGFFYLMVATRRVYGQGWWKTYFKVNILLFIYTIVLLIGFAITFGVSVFLARMTDEGRTILDLFS